MSNLIIPEAYELILREELPDIQSVGYLLKHKKSGARVMLIENEDVNKVFNITFRTTPSNSTGVAHIMEHSVLSGSRSFPTKDPFVELVKGSMNTFLNAMTYPDKTMYPTASCNDKDFANLMHVYLDAVFYPNIYSRKQIFLQEGWRYVLETPESDLELNGVVYNEMKGAYSSPDDVVEHEISSMLFPDTTYHHESGGDPKVIPQLSYEEFLDFHRTYYHPSNSYIYLYGKMDFTERLEWMDREYLSGFENIPVQSGIGLQKPFEQVKYCEIQYPVQSTEDDTENAYLTWNACIGTSLDTKLANSFAVLEYVLLSSAGAPLKEALLHSGIGKDIQSSYDSGTYQPVFSVLAKGARPEDQERFVQVIRDTLTQIVETGLDEDAIYAAINLMEFRFREADYGSIPKGLIYGIDVFDSWLYDEEKPFDYLRAGEDYAFLKEQVGTGYYEDLIRTWLLNNKHVVVMTAKANPGMAAQADRELKKELAGRKAAMSPEEIDAIVRQTKELKIYQETPSTQEELQTIPMLGIEDLEKKAAPIRNEIYEWNKVQLLHHACATNGIAYLKVILDASMVAQEDLEYLGMLAKVLGMVNTEHYTYGALANQMNRNTGGIITAPGIYADPKNRDRLRLSLAFRARTLYDKIPFCFEMIREMLFTSDLAQKDRIRELLNQGRSRLAVSLQEGGNTAAASRCKSYFSNYAYANDRLNGIGYYDKIKELTDDFEGCWEQITRSLSRVRSALLNRGRILIDYTGDASNLETIRVLSEELSADILAAAEHPVQEPESAPEPVIRDYHIVREQHSNEAFKTAGEVQYVARCGNYRDAGYRYNGSLKVLRTIMSYEYLWSNIRVTGGAYGCSALFLRNGDCTFTSYRDPNLRRTCKVYDGIPEYLRSFTVDPRDMTKYIIGTISEMDAPLTPSAEGFRSFSAWISGTTMEDLQRERDEVLSTGQEEIRALADHMEAALSQHYLCTIGSEAKIDEDQDLFDTVREL